MCVCGGGGGGGGQNYIGMFRDECVQRPVQILIRLRECGD